MLSTAAAAAAAAAAADAAVAAAADGIVYAAFAATACRCRFCFVQETIERDLEKLGNVLKMRERSMLYSMKLETKLGRLNQMLEVGREWARKHSHLYLRVDTPTSSVVHLRSRLACAGRLTPAAAVLTFSLRNICTVYNIFLPLVARDVGIKNGLEKLCCHWKQRA